MLGVHNHRTSPILQVSNAPLCDAVLEVSVDATKCQLLSLNLTIESKSIVRETSIVSMISLDGDVVTVRITFECLFGRERLDGVVRFLHVYIGEATEMIDEHRGASETFVGRFSFALCDQPGGGAFQLVHGDDVSRGLS